MDILIGALTLGCAAVLFLAPLSAGALLLFHTIEYVERMRRG